MKKKLFLNLSAIAIAIVMIIPLVSAILPAGYLIERGRVYADQPGDTSPIKALICQPGTDETELNFAWLDNTGEDGSVYVAEWTDDPELLDEDGFPLEVQFEEWSDKTPLLYKTDNSRYYADYETNRATVSGLKPDVDYVYRVGNGDEYSDIYDFRIKGTKEKWSFYFSGDPQLNNTYGSQNYSVKQWISTIDKIRDVDPDASLFVLGGDLADAGGGDESQLVEGLLAPETIKEYAVATSCSRSCCLPTNCSSRSPWPVWPRGRRRPRFSCPCGRMSRRPYCPGSAPASSRPFSPCRSSLS